MCRVLVLAPDPAAQRRVCRVLVLAPDPVVSGCTCLVLVLAPGPVVLTLALVACVLGPVRRRLLSPAARSVSQVAEAAATRQRQLTVGAALLPPYLIEAGRGDEWR
jgi:hypothetical protein